MGVVATLLACGPAAREAPEGGGTRAPGSGRAPSGLVGRVGELLDVAVPLVGGGTQALAELRGQPVLLELSDAGSPGREQAQARWRALVDRREDALAVVSVALDAEASALPASWTDDPPPFVLGWDPQGALAARLQLAVLPTVVLIDARGAIVAVFEGEPPDDAAIERWLAADPGTQALG